MHFLYLRKAADPTAPVLENPYLTAWPGDRTYNWGNKIGTDTRWVRADRQGDWAQTQLVVKDGTEYFQLNFNHREALGRVTDMDVIPAS